MRHAVRFLGFGLLFGFVLSRVGATDFDAIAGMFLLTDLHLMGVIGLAIVVAGLGLQVFRRREAPTLTPKPVKPGLIVGSVLFGAGWALTGTCPGTGLAQLGEGKLMALFTVGGILMGTALYRAVGKQLEARLGARSQARPHSAVSVPPVSAAATAQP